MERSADVLDAASDLALTESQSLVSAISAAAKRGDAALKPNGACYYCSADVERPKIYCDSDCADDHAALLKARGRLGR